MYYTYILENNSGRLYIGQTNNLEDRLKRHNENRSAYTKSKGLWKLIYKKQFDSRAEAMQFEKYLKSLKNPKYIKSTIINS